MFKQICIMASGNGTNAEAIVKYLNKYNNIKFICVCNKKEGNANIYNRMKNLGIGCLYLPFEKNLEFFKKNRFDLVVLAG